MRLDVVCLAPLLIILLALCRPDRFREIVDTQIAFVRYAESRNDITVQELVTCPIKIVGQILSGMSPSCRGIARRKQKNAQKGLIDSPVDSPSTTRAVQYRVWTLEELSKFDGSISLSNPRGRVYLSVGGIVFDVTTGRHFYGIGSHYR